MFQPPNLTEKDTEAQKMMNFHFQGLLLFNSEDSRTLTQDWGNRLLEGTNRTLSTPGPRRKEQPQETDPDMPRSVQESQAEV